MARLMKISKGGQLTIPAAIRKRWGTNDVRLVDEGGRLIVEPAPDEAWLQAIENARGSLADYFPKDLSTQEMREQYRREESEIEDERARRRLGLD